jgi:hypothetical protein
VKKKLKNLRLERRRNGRPSKTYIEVGHMLQSLRPDADKVGGI